MAEPTQKPGSGELESEQLPAALVYRHSVSLIWLVPLVAALIGGWLIYKTVTETGPRITITFRDAEGLEPGKTKIKFKDVEIGKVEEIRLNKDLSRVIVTASLVKEAEDYLGEDTQFWVVRARVAATEVSGLSTLFSGAYIGVYPGASRSDVRDFVGLEEEPVLRKGIAGRQFFLKAETLGSLNTGSPVYFRQIKVGQVLGYQFSPEGEGLLINIFIEAPHDAQVRSNSRFWNASGLDFSLGVGGAQLHAESLMSILSGGIAFATPSGILAGEPVEEGEQFPLHQNQQNSFQKIYTRKVRLLMVFEQPVRGLVVGSPVELRGLPIGRVLDVNLDFDMNSRAFRIPVLVEIEPERIRLLNAEGATFSTVLEQLVDLGLRARLKTGNLVTGQMIIELDLHPGQAAQKLGRQGEHLLLPVLESAQTDLFGTLDSLAAKLNQIPYAELSGELHQGLAELRATLAQIRQLVAGVDRELLPGATATLQEADKALVQGQQTLAQGQKVLVQLEQALDQDAPLSRETTQAMQELARAARSLRLLADYLEQHPEALLRGR